MLAPAQLTSAEECQGITVEQYVLQECNRIAASIQVRLPTPAASSLARPLHAALHASRCSTAADASSADAAQTQAEAQVGKLRQDWAAKKAAWLDMAG